MFLASFVLRNSQFLIIVSDNSATIYEIYMIYVIYNILIYLQKHIFRKMFIYLKNIRKKPEIKILITASITRLYVYDIYHILNKSCNG